MGQVSTIMRSITSKDGCLLSLFHKFNDGGTISSNNITSLKEMLIDNHKVVANKGIFGGHLPVEHTFGFFKTIKKITKNLGFHLTIKTNDVQEIIFPTIANDINVTKNTLCLFVPILIPKSQTQVLINKSNKNNYTFTYDSWYTERELSTAR